jgi:hypothetical protein
MPMWGFELQLGCPSLPAWGTSFKLDRSRPNLNVQGASSEAAKCDAFV